MYSKEDLKNMISAYRKIEQYVNIYWRPMLLRNERICKCGFGFDSSNIWYNEAYFHHAPGCLSVYECPESAVGLILNWEEIKNGVEEVFVARECTKKRIREFRV